MIQHGVGCSGLFGPFFYDVWGVCGPFGLGVGGAGVSGLSSCGLCRWWCGAGVSGPEET